MLEKTITVASGHACAGAVARSNGETGLVALSFRADRIRAQRTTSCAFARHRVRRFLREQIDNFECAVGATSDDGTCSLAPHECNAGAATGRYSRASCLDQGWGVTYRQRNW